MKSADLPVFGGIDTIYESDIDDDNYSVAENSEILERRRKSHTEAEQRRRNAIKRGFETLRELVYPLKGNGNSTRLSKLLILNKSVTEIKKLVQEANQKDLEVSSLERTAETLRLTTAFYGSKVQQVSSTSASLMEPIGDEPKLRIFELLSSGLFSSFNSAISLSSFRQFAEDFLNWLEEICAQEVLYKLVESIIPEVLPPGPNVAQDSTENRCLTTALRASRTAMGFSAPNKPVNESGFLDWNNFQCGSVSGNARFPDAASKSFLCEMKQSPLHSAFPAFPSPGQRTRSCKNSGSDPVHLQPNVPGFVTPLSSCESIVKPFPYGADELVSSDSSVPPPEHSHPTLHVKARPPNSYPPAVFTGALLSMPSSMALPDSAAFRAPQTSFQPFD